MTTKGGGKNPVTADVLDLNEISTFLNKEGYEVVNLKQPWRHVVGKVKKNGKEFFFKIASTEEIGKKTKNQIDWSEKTSKTLKTMKVPEIKDKGEYKGLPWFTNEYIEGPLLADYVKDKGRGTKDLKESLEKVALTAKEIMELSSDVLSPKQNQEKVQLIKEKMIEKVDGWIELVDKKESVIELRKFMTEKLPEVQFAPSFGDFVPWHMIKRNEEIYLIDSEHGKMEGIKFYDVAYFYHRVFTKLQTPEIADEFMQIFLKLYPMSDKDKETLRMILAQRLIGGYMDAQYDKTTSVELQDKMRDLLLKGEIV